MVSKQGVLTVNRGLGMVTLRDRPEQIRDVDAFLVRYEAESAQQIAVEVRALEVTLSASDSYGINWSRIWTAIFGSGSALSIAGTFATPLTLPLTLGLQDRNGAVDVLVKALSTQGKVKVLSQPSIRLLNGHPAVIQVGRVTAFVAEASQTTTGSLGTSTFTVRLGSVQDGVILPLTARVVGDDVVMNVAPILSRVREIRRVTSGTTTVEAPDVDNRALQTTVRLKSGETVVLGGLISTSDTDNRSGFPGILRTFKLGWLTGSLEQASQRTEVVLTLTPKIVPALTAARRGRESR
jgi:MSHA biogenesis protein MshL